MRRVKKLIAGVVLGAIMAASGGQALAAPDAVQELTDNYKSSTAVSVSQPASIISTSRAMRIALNRVGGGYVVDIERDWENGRYVYDVEVRKHGREYDVRINARTGRVIFSRLDREDSNYGGGRRIRISYSRARAIALRNVGGGRVTDIERDWENGRYIYEVEVHKGYREYTVKISARTGRVLAKYVEYDD